MQYRSMSFGARTISLSNIEKLNPKIKKAAAKMLNDDPLNLFYSLMVNEYNSRGGRFIGDGDVCAGGYCLVLIPIRGPP